ncbi:hypothetical protein EJ357_18440 [Streptomyces cyaneochromogenes]|uniref:Uncharacterized protein n=1 Tax=Streptomyces cyaneochromogenes TaxID=2496836 RepID=A0A3S9M7M1_9ACTN|nr:hypothetical protein EJ357_18440 [Streptomyces cyaneochromogenes]
MVRVTTRAAWAAAPPPPPTCDVCGALTAQRDAAREAGRTAEASACERELREHWSLGRGCTR